MSARVEKIRERLFGDEVDPFDPSEGGYASIPFVLRRAQFLFSPRAWQVYTYVCMRIGPDGIGWMTLGEMAWDLDFRNPAKLRPYVNELEKKGWLLRKHSRSRDYYLAPNPVDVLRDLHEKQPFPPDRVEAIDEVLESLGQPHLEPA